MDGEKRRQLILLQDALRTFLDGLTIMQSYVDRPRTIEQYENLYDEANRLLNDPKLEMYAPRVRLSNVNRSSSDRWGTESNRLVESAGKLREHISRLIELETQQSVRSAARVKVFISHGRESPALELTRDFIAALGLEPVIAEKSASTGKSVDAKIRGYMEGCQAAVILATGDDRVMAAATLQPRQNVIHEIGLAQEILKDRATYLLEENTQFPSNIAPKVYERFTKDNVTKGFIAIARDLKAFGHL